MATFEDQFIERSGLRYTDVKLSYPEIMKRIGQAKDLLKLPFFAVTVNYSPEVALSLCLTIEECMDRNTTTYVAITDVDKAVTCRGVDLRANNITDLR